MNVFKDVYNYRRIAGNDDSNKIFGTNNKIFETNKKKQSNI